MQLSTKGRYAVMAMAVITVRGLGRPVSLSEISQDQSLPIDYLEQLFLKLRRAGLVKALRGPGGGYLLAQPASAISIADIMQAVDEPVKMTRCSGAGEDRCLRESRCITHNLWDALGDHINAFLKSVSLQRAVDMRRQGAAPGLEALALEKLP